MAQSISQLAYEAERNKIRRARAEARLSPIGDDQLVEGLRKQSDAKSWWIETHGSSGRWPQQDVERKREELRVLVQAADRIEGLGAPNEPGSG